MNTEPFHIQRIRIKDIVTFARGCLHNPAFGKVAPISILRAASQARNPHADPQDTALLVAYANGRCIGYHGLLPGCLRYGDRLSKVSWLVTFYVDRDARGHGYGRRLVSEVLKLNHDLVTTGITAGADAVYRKAGFRYLGELTYYQVRSQASDIYARAIQQPAFQGGEMRVKAVSHLSEIQGGRSSAVAFQRDIATINWMIRNPWVESRETAGRDLEHYYFSRVRDFYRCFALEIRALDGKAGRGYVVLSVSRHKRKSILKVLDLCLARPALLPLAGRVVLGQARDFAVERLEYPACLAPFFEAQPELAPLIKRKKRTYLYRPCHDASPLARLAPEVELQYADSDTAFT